MRVQGLLDMRSEGLFTAFQLLQVVDGGIIVGTEKTKGGENQELYF